MRFMTKIRIKVLQKIKMIVVISNSNLFLNSRRPSHIKITLHKVTKSVEEKELLCMLNYYLKKILKLLKDIGAIQHFYYQHH